MNVRRWSGVLLLITCALVWSIGAYGQDKGKQDKDKQDKSKTPAKTETPPKAETPAPATGDGTTFVLKAFEPKGKTFYQSITTKTKQVMKVMGMEVTQEQAQTFYLSWTPEEIKDGNLVVKQKIIGVKMDIEIGGNKISYDSTAKEPPPANPLTDFFKALKDAEFKVFVNNDPKSDKYMSVVKVEGRKEFVAKLAAANMQLQPLLDSILSDDALKAMTEPAFGVIPPRGVVPSDKKWTRQSKLDMGPIGLYDTTYNYTYKGTKDKIAEVEFTTNLKYSPPTKKEGLPFKITKGELTSKGGKGIAHFDLEKGRVADSTMDPDVNKATEKLVLDGNLTIEIGGMSTEVTLSQTQTADLKTYDTDPTASKK
jgi:hypothetical protein